MIIVVIIIMIGKWHFGGGGGAVQNYSSNISKFYEHKKSQKTQ